jgi:hypothetical protein
MQRLVEAGLLNREQITLVHLGKSAAVIWMLNPFAALLSASTATGKLVLQGGCAEDQLALSTENQGDDNARYLE